MKHIFSTTQAMRIVYVTSFLVAIGYLTGCASVGARAGDGAGRPYAGVRYDLHYLAHPEEADQSGIQFMNLFDLPFSAVADTLLLPHDLWAAQGTTNTAAK